MSNCIKYEYYNRYKMHKLDILEKNEIFFKKGVDKK